MFWFRVSVSASGWNAPLVHMVCAKLSAALNSSVSTSLVSEPSLFRRQLLGALNIAFQMLGRRLSIPNVSLVPVPFGSSCEKATNIRITSSALAEDVLDDRRGIRVLAGQH